MRQREPTEWVVFRLPADSRGVAMNAICSQDEWDLMERTQPGQNKIVRGNIASETEAERLVRSLITPEDPKSKRKR
jgi:hypothetical protein